MERRGRKRNTELEFIVELYNSGVSIVKISEQTGKSKQAIYNILKTRGVPLRKERPDADEIILYNGKKYSWSKDCWRCTVGNRMSLTRRIWEDNFGPIPNNHKIYFVDGNRYNVDPSNLACMTESDHQKERLKDDDARAIFSACGAYARLLRDIKRAIDPELVKASTQKAWATRRMKGTDKHGKKVWEQRLKRYGPSGCKDPKKAGENRSKARKNKININK